MMKIVDQGLTTIASDEIDALACSLIGYCYIPRKTLERIANHSSSKARARSLPVYCWYKRLCQLPTPPEVKGKLQNAIVHA